MCPCGVGFRVCARRPVFMSKSRFEKKARFVMKAAMAAALAFSCMSLRAASPPAKEEVHTGPISYYKQIRPILQANCQGCHQPAKAKGEYVMTDFARMLGTGDS